MIKTTKDIAEKQIIIIDLILNREYDVAIEAIEELQDDIVRLNTWG